MAGYLGWHATTTGGPASVLDIGCGTGVLRTRLGDQDVSSYVGVDLSDAAIERARQRSLADSDFVVGDAADPAMALDPADVVVLNEMLYYVADPDEFLERVERLVRPGGLVIVSMWRHPGDRHLWRVVDDRWDRLDRVEVCNRDNEVNGRGWRIAAYRPGLS